MPSGTPLVGRLESNVPAQGTAGTVQTTVIGEAPTAATVTAASITPNAAVTGHATNYRTFTLTNKGQDGTGTTSIGTFSTSSTPANDLAAGDERALTLSGTAANLDVAEGDILAMVETVAASGVAHGGYRVQVELTRR
jgi:hypothetical protein